MRVRKVARSGCEWSSGCQWVRARRLDWFERFSGVYAAMRVYMLYAVDKIWSKGGGGGGRGEEGSSSGGSGGGSGGNGSSIVIECVRDACSVIWLDKSQAVQLSNWVWVHTCACDAKERGGKKERGIACVIRVKKKEKNVYSKKERCQ